MDELGDFILSYFISILIKVKGFMISVFTSNLDKRGSTQREALATHSVEKNLELILPIVNPPKLVPK